MFFLFFFNVFANLRTDRKNWAIALFQLKKLCLQIYKHTLMDFLKKMLFNVENKNVIVIFGHTLKNDK